jgi:hypothetical protein
VSDIHILEVVGIIVVGDTVAELKGYILDVIDFDFAPKAVGVKDVDIV